ncbi:MAG: M23 family metallopeptidase [Bacteroidota bacterium]|nr:M23 family metallopeptidase [Bacteroidota bacterium]
MPESYSSFQKDTVLMRISISLLVVISILSCQNSCAPEKDESVICPSHRTSEYVLPYPIGKTYLCIQGYVGRTYHQGVFIYGLDFSMPIGSIVTAARSGSVVFIEESFSDEDYGIEKANVVVILHADGTFGRYIHLTKNGALVKVNQIVAQGDPIGLSGSSGYSPMPHLHFDVTTGCPQSNCQTIPICFKNTKPHPYGLETGESYTAEPY